MRGADGVRGWRVAALRPYRPVCAEIPQRTDRYVRRGDGTDRYVLGGIETDRYVRVGLVWASRAAHMRVGASRKGLKRVDTCVGGRAHVQGTRAAAGVTTTIPDSTSARMRSGQT